MFKKKNKVVKSLIWKFVAIKYVDGKHVSSEENIEPEKLDMTKIFNDAKENGTMILIISGGYYQGFWIRLSDDNFYSIPLPY